MSRAKKPAAASLFDWAGVSPVAPTAPEPELADTVAVAATVEKALIESVEAAPASVYVPHEEPRATAQTPEGVTKLRESYAFCEPDGHGGFWTGRVDGERAHASVRYSRAHLCELRTRIDAALALEQSEGR